MSGWVSCARHLRTGRLSAWAWAADTCAMNVERIVPNLVVSDLRQAVDEHVAVLGLDVVMDRDGSDEVTGDGFRPPRSGTEPPLRLDEAGCSSLRPDKESVERATSFPGGCMWRLMMPHRSRWTTVATLTPLLRSGHEQSLENCRRTSQYTAERG